ncbi:MAG: hypothetical protein L0099_06120 [Acidobacteria bacterium]|nr:hypothetical protein [Acidobacteriota bacterium]
MFHHGGHRGHGGRLSGGGVVQRREFGDFFFGNSNHGIDVFGTLVRLGDGVGEIAIIGMLADDVLLEQGLEAGVAGVGGGDLHEPEQQGSLLVVNALL